MPKENFEGYKKPEPTLPRNGRGDDGMKAEWVHAIMANEPTLAYSNFDIAGMLTETILLGNVAMRAGKKLEWDAENMKFTNAPEAEKYLHFEYRKGWTLVSFPRASPQRQQGNGCPLLALRAGILRHFPARQRAINTRGCPDPSRIVFANSYPSYLPMRSRAGSSCGEPISTNK